MACTLTYVDGYIWKPDLGKFDVFNSYLNQHSETINVFDPWESEDKDCDGIIDVDSDDKPTETNPLVKDSDNDGLYDGFDINGAKGELYDQAYSIRNYGANEQSGSTSAINRDTDGDGISDGTEVLGYTTIITIAPNTSPTELNIISDPTLTDTDGDTVSDQEERYYCTSPLKTDSDEDGLSDDTELSASYDMGGKSYPSNPSRWDTDGDGLPDGGIDGLIFDTTDKVWEIAEASKNDQIDFWEGEDRDCDGEIDTYSSKNTESNPRKIDSDGDGIADNDEYYYYVQYVDLTHTDSNGYLKPTVKSNPDSSTDSHYPNPVDTDSDNDGLTDAQEDWGPIKGKLEGTTSSSCSDNTHFSNAYETNPYDDDSDGDGIKDGDDLWQDTDTTWERRWNVDTDGDGLINAMDTDSDGDGINDYSEVGSNGKREAGETDPFGTDSDDDGLQDGEEDCGTGKSGQIDGDYGLDGDPDTSDEGEYDGIWQDYETWTETDPTNPDTDGDGIGDGIENAVDTIKDIDEDTIINALDLDADGDGLPDILERNKEEAQKADSDEDGLLDGWVTLDASDDLSYYTDNGFEYKNNGDGTVTFLGEDKNNDGQIAGDTDNDRVWDSDEAWTETDPTKPDTDFDGIIDGDEVDKYVWLYEAEDYCFNANLIGSGGQKVECSITKEVLDIEKGVTAGKATIDYSYKRIVIKRDTSDPNRRGIETPMGLEDNDPDSADYNPGNDLQFEPDLFKIPLFLEEGYYRAYIKAKRGNTLSPGAEDKELASIIVSLEADVEDACFVGKDYQGNVVEHSHRENDDVIVLSNHKGKLKQDSGLDFMYEWYPVQPFYSYGVGVFHLSATDGRIIPEIRPTESFKALAPVNEKYRSPNNYNFVDTIMIEKIDVSKISGILYSELKDDNKVAISNPLDKDTDDDGLPDDYERTERRRVSAGDLKTKITTSPIDSDTDGDGLWDGDEEYPEKFDRDGIYNVKFRNCPFVTNPMDSDTDDDNAMDGDEFKTWPYAESWYSIEGTFPSNYLRIDLESGKKFNFNNIDIVDSSDTDRDNIKDGVEIDWNKDLPNDIETSDFYGYGDDYINALDMDSDNDGLPDGCVDGWDVSNQGQIIKSKINNIIEWWEFEDKNCNGEVEFGESRYDDRDTRNPPGSGNSETNPVNPDTDGDEATDYYDIDPIWDIILKFKIDEIKALDPVDAISEADFTLEVTIGEKTKSEKYTTDDSHITHDVTKTVNVPDDHCGVEIELWLRDRDDGPTDSDTCDIDSGGDDLCQGIFWLDTQEWTGEGKITDTLCVLDRVYNNFVVEQKITTNGRDDGGEKEWGCDWFSHNDDCRVTFKIHKSATLSPQQKRDLAKKFSPALEFPESDIYGELLGLSDSNRPISIEQYLDDCRLSSAGFEYEGDDILDKMANYGDKYFLDHRLQPNVYEFNAIISVISIILTIAGVGIILSIMKWVWDITAGLWLKYSTGEALNELYTESKNNGAPAYVNADLIEYGEYNPGSTDNTRIYIQYWFFFPVDNGDRMINSLSTPIPLNPLGFSTAHEGDWTLVQVNLKPDSDTINPMEY